MDISKEKEEALRVKIVEKFNKYRAELKQKLKGASKNQLISYLAQVIMEGEEYKAIQERLVRESMEVREQLKAANETIKELSGEEVKESVGPSSD